MATWPLIIHLAVGGLASIVMVPRHAVIPFLGGCFMWFYTSPVAYEAGLVVVIMIGFFAGAIDATGGG